MQFELIEALGSKIYGYIVPSHKDGAFLFTDAELGLQATRRIRLGIGATEAYGLRDGREVLTKYVQPDPDTAGQYRIVSGWSHSYAMHDWLRQGVQVVAFQEVAPISDAFSAAGDSQRMPDQLAH